MVKIDNRLADSELCYRSPKARVVEANVQGVLCQSKESLLYRTETEEEEDLLQ